MKSSKNQLNTSKSPEKKANPKADEENVQSDDQMKRLESITTTDNKSLLNAAIEDYHIALRVLSTESIYEKFSLDDLLDICAAHEQIALALMTDEKFIENANGSHMAILAKKQIKIAKMLETHSNEKLTKFYEYCNKFDIFGHHFELARQLLDNDGINTQSARSIALLGARHEAIANIILNRSELLTKLTPSFLCTLGMGHPTIARKLVTEAKYNIKAHTLSWAILGSVDSELSKKMLHDRTFRENATRRELIILAKVNRVNLGIIITDDYLYNKLGFAGLTELTKYYGHLSAKVLARRDLIISECLIPFLGPEGMSKEIAEYLLEKEEIRTKLPESLLRTIALVDAKFAEIILDDPNLKKILSNFSLSWIGENYIFLCKKILE